MAKVTPSMAKGHIKRSLLQIIDKHPNKTEKQQVWRHFDNQCAYCGAVLEINSRQGHLDHLLAVQEGGSNDIYNFVLACHICNGDEKREMPWRKFLTNKCKTLHTNVFTERLVKIEEWQQKSVIKQLDNELMTQIEDIIKVAQADFEKSVEKMRELRDSTIIN